MSSQRFQFTTRTGLEICLLPTLSLLTLLVAGGLYRGNRAIILRGFEEKLTAASTVTAAFIDPVDHASLMTRFSAAGVAFEPGADAYFALDATQHQLLRLRGSNGVALPNPVAVAEGLTGLSYDEKTGLLYTLEPGGARLLSLDPASGQTTVRLALGQHRGTAISPGLEPGTLLIASDRLLLIDLVANTVSEIGTQPLPLVSALAVEVGPRRLWGIAPATRSLQQINLATGELMAGFPLPASTPLPNVLVYDSRRRAIIGANTSFYKFDLTTGQPAPLDFLPALGKEMSPTYQRYAGPMRRLKDELQLTFLYTQVVTNGTQIAYGIDATQGEQHSALHATDVLPKEEVAGVEELLKRGALHQTGVRHWAEWGLLKSTFAPVFDGTGKVIAMVGADVDISEIEKRTRAALLTIFILGVGTLLVASGASLYIAKQLRRPFEQITAKTLEVAAGRYTGRLALTKPVELRDLSNTFNQIAGSLEQSMETLQSSIRELLDRRNRHELVRTLAQRHRADTELHDLANASAHWTDANAALNSPNGAVRVGHRVVIWFAEPAADPVASLSLRSTLALRLRARLLAMSAGSGGVPPLLREVRLLLVIDVVARTVQVSAPASFATPSHTRSGDRDEWSDGKLEIELVGFSLTKAVS